MNESKGSVATKNETIEEAVSEITRELRVRAAVYPRLVENGKLTQGEATRRERALRSAVFYLLTLAQTQIGTSVTTGERV